MKTITFAIPCYNSAAYMDKCIESLLPCGDDIEIIIVNDGSTKDNTSEKAHEWAERYPSIIRAIDQENRGHGGAVNHGLKAAHGLYFKVVDSDDWLDVEAMRSVMAYLRKQVERRNPTDLVVANYIYDKVYEGKSTVIDYRNVFPEDREFTWDEIGRFRPSQYLLMHSVIYRTDVLREENLELPEHCFYVDNIFVYVPLPCVRTLYYLNVDMYHYFIGREDQSVNEKIMLSRIDQQLTVTRFMIDSADTSCVPQPKLARYMINYLSMMMCICSVFLRMEKSPEAENKRSAIWDYLKNRNPEMYRDVRRNILSIGVNLPGELGRRIGLGGYHIAQKIFKFN